MDIAAEKRTVAEQQALTSRLQKQLSESSAEVVSLSKKLASAEDINALAVQVLL